MYLFVNNLQRQKTILILYDSNTLLLGVLLYLCGLVVL